MQRKSIVPYLYLLPAFMIFAVFMIIPLFTATALSFTNWDLITDIEFIGIRNYVRLYSDKTFGRALTNTAYFSIGTVPIQMALALITAMLLNSKIMLKSFFRGLYFLPVLVPVTVAAFVWMFIFSPSFGLLNFLLGLMGLERIGWLSDPNWAMPALIIMSVWQNFGYHTVIYLAGLQNIPTELIEAAEIDGANSWMRFWKIVFPLLSPTTFLVLVMSIIGGFQVFQIVQITTGGGPVGSTNVVVFHLYRTAFEYFDMGYATAMTLIVFIIILILTILQIKVVGSKVHYQ